MKRFSWKKLLRLPGPKDLGMSDNDCAMPSSMWPPSDGRPTWEDFYAKLKELFPIRYFFGRSIPTFIRRKIYYPIRRPVIDSIYWIKCHILPSHKFHLIDIRQKKSDISDVDDYRYGYREVSDRMLLACFTLLNSFVEEEDGGYCPTSKQIEEAEDDIKDCLIKQRNESIEMMAIYNWWNLDRKVDFKIKQDIKGIYYKTIKSIGNKNSKETNELWDKYNKVDQDFDSKEEEMLIRLIKIRHKLWT